MPIYDTLRSWGNGARGGHAQGRNVVVTVLLGGFIVSIKQSSLHGRDRNMES